MGDGGMMDGGMMGAMGIWVFLLVAVLLAVLVAAVLGSVWLVRRLSSGTDQAAPSQGPDDASDTLRRRYAAGEIDDDEYARRRSTLESG